MGICFSLCEKNTTDNVVIQARPLRKKPPSIKFVANRPRTTRFTGKS